MSDATVRESRRVATVAAMLDMGPDHVRLLIKSGELEAHRIGKCGIRIFLDSVQSYQERQAVVPAPTRKAPHPHTAAARKRTARTAHERSVAELRRLGLRI